MAPPLTAAVSFWRIRAAGTNHSSNGGGPTKSEPRDGHTTEMVEEVVADHSSMTTTTAVSVCAVLETDEGTTRGKYTVYYNVDDGEEGDLKDNNGGGGGGGGGGYAVVSGGGEEEDWKRILRMRKGDDASMGWYRHQDLTVLDGNVVRLWDWNCCSSRRKLN